MCSYNSCTVFQKRRKDKHHKKQKKDKSRSISDEGSSSSPDEPVSTKLVAPVSASVTTKVPSEDLSEGNLLKRLKSALPGKRLKAADFM